MMNVMAYVNKTWLQSARKLNGKRKDVLTCGKNTMLKSSCKKYGVKDFYLLFFGNSVLSTLLLEFYFFYTLEFY